MSKNSLFKGPLNWIYETFKKDTSKMLIVTGTLGWALSSLAQIGAIMINPKISSEKKSFLLPQEFMDAFNNIVAFMCITLLTKKTISKMASTGKIAPSKVRNYLNKNIDLYKDKIGKSTFDLDEVLKNDAKFPAESYYAYKNFVTTVGTVGASILSCNIVTPIIRNATASSVQKHYIDSKNKSVHTYPNTSGSMKI